MNDRLKTLAKQAGIWFEDTKDIRTHSVSTTTLEKFAELIVRECVGIVDNAERGGSNDIWDNAVKFIRRDLQEHFGVE